jgi:3-phenylpropionate/cinnamic acid dioxygenase small subunit
MSQLELFCSIQENPMQRSDKGEMRKVFQWSIWLVTGIVLMLGVTGCRNTNDKRAEDVLAQRLHAVEDRVEIQQLITSDYSTALDTRDWKTFGSLFTEDGEFNLYAKQFPPRIHKGRSAIENAFSAPPPPGEPLDSTSVKHVITNPHIQVNGDQAMATAYWEEVAIEKDGNVSIRVTGYYRDALKRDQRRWRFQKREVFAYDMPSLGAQEASTSTSSSASR